MVWQSCDSKLSFFFLLETLLRVSSFFAITTLYCACNVFQVAHVFKGFYCSLNRAIADLSHGWGQKCVVFLNFILIENNLNSQTILYYTVR